MFDIDEKLTKCGRYTYCWPRNKLYFKYLANNTFFLQNVAQYHFSNRNRIEREIMTYYDEIIDSIQASQKITTLVTENRETLPIWLASFLAFKLDLVGAEYITSSHGISVKNATKDLNNQGSQYLPEESMEFVEKIRKIFEIAENEGQYEIKFSNADNILKGYSP